MASADVILDEVTSEQFKSMRNTFSEKATEIYFRILTKLIPQLATERLEVFRQSIGNYLLKFPYNDAKKQYWHEFLQSNREYLELSAILSNH